MPRPCHDRHPPSPDTCRVCWLAAHDARYAALWAGDAPAKRKADPSKPRVAKGVPP